MYIVLLRHGQAEKAEERKSDAERSLTEAGQRTMRATLPRALRLLPPEGRVTIWCSPLLRARQTADIAADCVRDVWGGARLVPEPPLPLEELAETGINGILAMLI